MGAEAVGKDDGEELGGEDRAAAGEGMEPYELYLHHSSDPYMARR